MAIDAVNILSQNRGKYVYYQRLKDNGYTTLYNNALSDFGQELGEENIGASSLSSYFYSLANSELTKEQAMLNKVFGAYIVGNYSDGPDFAKELIEAINYALGLKDVFQRNLSVILETQGQKGVFSDFPTYFNRVWKKKADAIANEVGKLMESNRNTDLAILAKEVADKYLPELTREAIIEMFSAKPEINNDKRYINSYQAVINALNDSRYDKISNSFIDAFRKNYKLDELINILVEDKNNKEKGYKIISGNSRGRFNIEADFYQRAGVSLEIYENFLTNLAAQQIGSGGSGNITYTMESIHTGDTKMKADNIILLNVDTSIVEKWLETEQFGDRDKNTKAIKNLQDQLSSFDDGFIVYTSAKNYTLNEKFEAVYGGYSAGKSTSLNNLGTIFTNMNINIDSLITTIMQLIPGAIGQGKDDEVKLFLARAIASSLFDDFNTIGQSIETPSGPTAIHLFDLQGTLMPLSYYFQLLGDAFAKFQSIKDNNIRQLIRVTISHPKQIMFPEETHNIYSRKYLNVENWNAQASAALSQSKVEYHFLSGLREILGKIFAN